MLHRPLSAGATPRSFILNLWLVAGVLAAVITVGGAVYYRNEQETLFASVRRELNSVTELKLRQLNEWRNERLNDGRFLTHTPAVARDIAALVANPRSEAAHAAVSDWLRPLKGGDRYESILLLDRELRVRFAISESSDPPGPVLRGVATRGFAAAEVLLTDLHEGDAGAPPHFDLLAPIFPTTGGDTRPLALVVLRLRPERFLFPLLQSWPTESSTAETLLLRREGKDVVYLNELRHRPHRPLTLRGAAEDVLPPTGSGRGPATVQESVDYRGVAVLAATKPVPGTDWILVAKVDRAEAYASLRAEAWEVASIVFLLLVSLGGAAAYLWRMKNEQLLLRALAAETQARSYSERLAHLARQANDPVLLADGEFHILEANDCALATYGYTLAEMQQRLLPDLRPPGERHRFQQDLQRLHASGSSRLETLHQRRDGTVFPIEMSSRRVEIDGATYILDVVRDITERKRQEKESHDLTRALRTLSQCNQVLVRATNEPELLRHICRAILEEGGYRMAWVGYARDDEGKSVEPMAQEGFEQGYLSAARITWADVDRGRGPTGTCIRTGQHAVCRDILGDPRFAPWREEAVRRGYAALLALPLRAGERVFGALNIFSADAEAFEDSEVRLLEELAEDLAYGINVLRTRAEHERAEAALHRAEERYRSLFENSHAVTLLVDPATGAIVDANPAAARFYGWSRAELQQRNVAGLNLLSPEQIHAELEEARARRRTTFIFKHRLADGSIRDVEVFSGPIPGDGRELLVSIIHDITERRAAEVALRDSEERLRLFIQHAPVSLAMFDREMRYLHASRRWLSDYHLAEAGLRGRSHYEVFPEISAELKDVYRRALGGGVVRADEDRFVRPDGTVLWLRWEVHPWRTAAGAVGGIVIFSEDITEQKRAHQVQAEQLQELQRWQSVTLGRESRALELKAEVNRLLAALGQPPRYRSAVDEEKQP